tara:strand:- start:302 stop:592 length:291 start_codon:yes stop_codon:yes gene_type:complete
MKHGYAHEQKAIVTRLHRIEGQVRGLEQMVEDNRYCIDILTQINAVTTALNSVALKILDGHVEHCVSDALTSGNQSTANEKRRELIDTIHRFTRAR